MMLLHLLTLLTTVQAQSTSNTLTPVSSSSTVLTTSQTSLLTAQSGGIFTITSDIPVTISRYNDDRYKDGEQPVFPTDASVIVTSDCADDGSVTPVISWDYSTGGAVSISLDGASSSSSSFLSEAASYDAAWEWRNWECDIYPTPAPFPFSALSLGPTQAGQVVKIKSQQGEQTLNEYQAEQKASGNSGEKGEEDSDDPFEEEEYKSTSGAVGMAVYRTALVGGLLIALFLPGREGEDLLVHPRLFALGKVVVAAAALSPLLPQHSRRVFSDTFRIFASSNANRVSHESPRSLQSGTCTYNVEILIDGCTHPLVINAPAARIVEALVMNSSSQKGNADDLCLYQYTADITFPVDSSVTTLDMSSGSIEVDALSYSECIRATDGRPFVDSRGESLIARPFARSGCETSGPTSSSWASHSNMCIALDSPPHDVNNHNVTAQYNPPPPTASLGEEWTQRALGEHASIASFSAFSISLMTNAAPVSLVQDALLAGMDEVRHARTSFEIASKLLGREVMPGALPESKHEFGRDLTKLALAVAREGCVDETLSAIAAAMESKELSQAMENGLDYHEKYSGLDALTATWIRDELSIIAMEESSHSALAWRTLFWVCRVDSQACDFVKREVLDASQLELRFNYRFASTFENKPESLADMMREWRKLYEAILSSLSLDESNWEMDGLLCSEADKRKELDDGSSILSELTNNILRGVLCNAHHASQFVRV